MKASERIQLTWTNISRGKFANLMKEAQGVLSIVKERLGNALTNNRIIKQFQLMLPFNLKNKIDFPEWINTNFIDGLKTKMRL